MLATQLAAEARRAPALAALRAKAATRPPGMEQPLTQPPIEIPTVSPTIMPAWAVTPSCTYGTKARGLTYEKKVGKYLTKLCNENGWKLWDHQWFLYAYGTERKYFQPDFLIERPSQEGIIVEVKLTYVDTTAQLQKYLEYLKIFGFIGFPLVIVRNLTPTLPCAIIDDFANATPNAVLHLWL